LVQVALVQQLELQQVQAAAIQFSQPFHQLAAVVVDQLVAVADFQAVQAVAHAVIQAQAVQVMRAVILL
jgi:hypothetical protein